MSVAAGPRPIFTSVCLGQDAVVMATNDEAPRVEWAVVPVSEKGNLGGDAEAERRLWRLCVMKWSRPLERKSRFNFTIQGRDAFSRHFHPLRDEGQPVAGAIGNAQRPNGKITLATLTFEPLTLYLKG